ncbi:MAG: hypothetical protein Q4C00_05295 [Bacillota bacterium]|nr:hypothetical protein [Bacillota bacterium]
MPGTTGHIQWLRQLRDSRLSQDERQTIHLASLDVLNSVGVRVDSPVAGEVFAGGTSLVTLAGTLVTHNAEVLSAFVLSQLTQKERAEDILPYHAGTGEMEGKTTAEERADAEVKPILDTPEVMPLPEGAASAIRSIIEETEEEYKEL